MAACSTISGGHDLTGVHESESFSAVSVYIHQLFPQLGFVQRQRGSRSRTVHRPEFKFARPFGERGIYRGKALGTHFLLTGYTVRDLLFHPLVQEYFNTSSYIGFQQKFGSRLTAAVLAEDLRSWRVQSTNYAIAQAFLPGGRFEFRANPRWDVQGSFLLSRGEGFHQYDNAQAIHSGLHARPPAGGRLRAAWERR